MPVDLSTLSDEELGIAAPGGGVPGFGPVQPITPAAPPSEEPGASFGHRLGAAFKAGPEGALNFYRSTLGEGNVRTNPQGEVEILDPQTGQWGPANPAGLDWGDLADLLAATPEAFGAGLGAVAGATAGSVVPGAGTAAGAIAGTAAGSALGNVVKQAIGAALPGAEDASLGERAADVGIATAFGAGAGALGPVARMAGRAITGGGAGAARAAEAQAIEAATGMRLAPGDRVGGAVKGMQDWAGRSWMGARQQEAYLAKNLELAERKMDDLVAGMGRSPATDAELGEKMRNLLVKEEEKLRLARQTDAGTLFAKVDADLGNVPTVSPTAFRQRLESMVREGTLSNGVKTAKAEGAAQILKNTPRMLTARDTQTLLEEYGRIGYASGSTDILPKLGITERVGISRQLFKMLNKDLDTSIAQYREVIGPGGPGEALRIARDSYAKHMAAAKQLRGSTLAKVIGRVTEADYPAIPDRILKRLRNPEQIEALMKQVAAIDPVAHAQIQQHTLAQALEAARAAAAAPAAGGGTFPIRGVTLAKALRDPRIARMFWDKPNVAHDLDMVEKGLSRLAMSSSAGSPTALNLEKMATLGAVTNPALWVKAGMYHGTNWLVARIMFNPEALAAAKKLASARVMSPEYRSALAVLTATLAKPDEE